jgi:eukaryotic-like serine/threonine-protein kinase
MTHDPGRLVAGRYDLIEVLGRGGMGEVWRARDQVLGRNVAIKELVLPRQAGAAERERFCARTIREARSAARLRHPGVVTIHDVIQQDGLPWIIMDLIAGPSLAEVIETDGPFPPVHAAKIGLQVLDALRAAHVAGIIHRDVKPSNILLESDRIVLTDFGIAALDGDATITESGLILGTPAFMAPEQARGFRATEKSDMWSLGATLYAAVEGEPPFRGLNSGAVFMALASEEPAPAANAGPLKAVIDGLLQKDPARRLRAEMVADLLRRVVAGRPAPTAPPTARLRTSPIAPRHSPAAGQPGMASLPDMLDTWLSRPWQRRRLPIEERSLLARSLNIPRLVMLTLVSPPFGLIVSGIFAISLYRRGRRDWEFKWALAVAAFAIPWCVVGIASLWIAGHLLADL